MHGLELVGRVGPTGAATYYDFDAIGSTAGITDNTGVYQNRYNYLPFGETLTSFETVDNRFRYVGSAGVSGEDHGLQYMRNRFYDPSLGVYTSMDPLLRPANQRYVYVRNNPVSWIDPRGLQASCSESCGYDLESVPLVTELDTGFDLAPDPLEEGFDISPDDDDEEWEFCTLELYWTFPGEGSCDDNNDDDGRHGNDGGLDGGTPTPDQSPDADGGTLETRGEFDPNQKMGPAGYGPQHFVSPQTLLAYRVDFENDPTATAPAQRVVVTDPLSNDLDWTTFQLTEVGFGDTRIAIPTQSQHFQTTVPMVLNGRSFQVEIEIGLSAPTGLITAVFQSIDATTGLPPDVLTGFLPPEDGTGRGMGYFSYTISAQTGLPTGTELRNVALITFGFNPSIATNQIDPHDPLL